MTKVKATQNKAEEIENKKIDLGVQNRLVILNSILPSQGNIITLTVAKDISEKVSFTQADTKKYNIRLVKDGQLSFDDTGSKKVSFSSAEIELMKTQIADLDTAKKITPNMLSTCLLIRDKL